MRLLFICIFSIAFIQCLGQNTLPQNIPGFNNNGDIKVAWFGPENNAGFVGRFQKMELGFILPNEITLLIEKFEAGSDGLNPFDPGQINFEAEFESPSGKKRYWNGFYYRQFTTDYYANAYYTEPTSYEWRLRFSPDETGTWLARIKIVAGGMTYLLDEAVPFFCVASEHKGFLKTVKENNGTAPYLAYSETGEAFFSIGNNVGHADLFVVTPHTSLSHQNWLRTLAANGGNFYRLELGGQNALPDWKHPTNYIEKLEEMWEYDKLIDLSFELNLYFSMFRHHVEVVDDTINYLSWQNNAYSSMLGIHNRTGFYKNQVSIDAQRNTLRYIFARWGYSVNFAFYGYSEVDNWTRNLKEELGSEVKALHTFRDWFVGHKKYIQDTLGFKDILFACSFAAMPDYELANPNAGIFKHCDIVAAHKYIDTREMNSHYLAPRTKFYYETWEKPILWEELGYSLPHVYCCTDIDFKREIWATSLMGAMGTGMHWWWEGMFQFGHTANFRKIADFFSDESPYLFSYAPHSWNDVLIGKTDKAEAFYLMASDKKRAIGWINNTSYNWRSLAKTNECVKSLVNTNRAKPPCVLDLNRDTVGVLKWMEKIDYSGKQYINKYTDAGGEPYNSSRENSFAISGLKSNTNQFLPSNGKHWYQVKFYPTSVGPLEASHTYIAHTTILGRLKIPVPILDADNPDYAFKIFYVGYGTKPPSDVSGEVIYEDEINIYPNPTSGKFIINSLSPFQGISVFSSTGQLMQHIKNLPDVLELEIEISFFNPGVYLVKVEFENGFYTRKVVKY